MTPHILITLITTITTTFCAYSMENIMALQTQHCMMNDVKIPLLLHNPNNQSSMQYTPQINIPTDALDKIIAYGSNKDRKNLKESCKQLAYVTSINRLDKLMIHDFNIGNETEKTILFKAIITSNNPKLITTIIEYARSNASLYSNVPNNAVCINFNENKSMQKYVQKRYLNPLLEEALKQENATLVELLQKQINDTSIIDTYNHQKKMKARATKCTIIATAIIITTVIGGIIGFTLTIISDPCTYNRTIHCIE